MSDEKTIKKHLYIIRHAESTSNANPTDQTPNPGLTDNGKTQAAKVQGPVDLLIVSPMRRTMQTYAHSTLQVKRLITSELVREYKIYGPSSRLDLEPATLTETPHQLNERARAAIQFVSEQKEHKIAILSHGVFLSEFAKILGKPLTTGMQNAQVIDLGHVTLPINTPPKFDK